MINWLTSLGNLTQIHSHYKGKFGMYFIQNPEQTPNPLLQNIALKMSYFIFTYFSHFSWLLPGHGKMLHSWYSRDGPRQGSPPYLGSGLLQTRLRFRIPLLQSRLHWDHGDQGDQAPLMVWAEYRPERKKSPDNPNKIRIENNNNELKQYLTPKQSFPLQI